MKKLDKLILGSFIGPFLLTFIVVDFILLTVNMLKYFDEIFGKGLGFGIYMELIGYFVISISPMAFPLAVLLSALMTFGNLGEHFELTAIKSSDISLLRALLPIGLFVVGLTFFVFYSNNYIVPKVNLKTFSLLYDMRMKSPALDIKEGVFYNGIPNYSIKVNKKVDDVRLFDILIYDHTSGRGNTDVITADSGRMEPFFNDRYMALTLYNGYSYQEMSEQKGIQEKPVGFNRTKFTENQIVFSLDAFEMSRTPEDLWSNNRSIKNIEQLKADLDSMDMEYNKGLYYHYINTGSAYSFFAKDRKIKIPDEVVRKKAIADSIQNLKMQEEYLSQQDSLMLAESNVGGGPDNVRATAPADPQQGPAEVVVPPPTVAEKDAVAQTDPVDTAPVQPTVSPVQTSVPKEVVNPVPPLNPEEKARLDSIINVPGFQSRAASIGLNTARTLKNNFSTNLLNLDNLDRESRRWEIAWYQKYSRAVACIVMFMIGAPLCAIIK